MENELFIYHKNATLDNLCEEWKDKWKACHNDKEKLVNLVMIQQSLPHFLTYCHQGKGLSKEYILDYFADYINGKYTGVNVDGVEGDYKTQMYVGCHGDLSASVDVASFQWCNTTFTVPECKATKFYVGCGSEVHLECEGYNSLVVMLFDNSKVWLDDVDEDSSVAIYRYSTDAKVEVGRFCFSDKVRIFDKQLKL